MLLVSKSGLCRKGDRSLRVPSPMSSPRFTPWWRGILRFWTRVVRARLSRLGLSCGAAPVAVLTPLREERNGT